MIKVFCDGGSRGNPGHCAFGFVVYREDKIIKEGSGYLGIETNNFAEYTALIKALTWIAAHLPEERLEVSMDSQLVVSQLTGLFKIKNPKIQVLAARVKFLEREVGTISYRHILRGQNKEADRLVNIALDKHQYGT